MSTPIHPIVSPWGRFGLYSYLIDAPEMAIVDTGIASSPAEGLAPALERLGRRIEDVRWILLTHGHIDHVGGAAALWELTGRRAEVVIHEADADFLRHRRTHVEEYLTGRGRYLHDPEGEAKQDAVTAAAIAGELQPTLLLRGGETLSLGGDVTVSVHAIPGHTAGSVAYAVDGREDVFVGDAVQIHGAANGFPGYVDPTAYRHGLVHLRDVVRPRRLHLGHPYRGADGTPFGTELDEATARRALTESIEIADRIAEAAARQLATGLPDSESPYSPFAQAAAELGYAGDPTLEPSPFFTTMHAHVVHANPRADTDRSIPT